MKYLLIIGALACQTNAFCQTTTAQPRLTNVEANKVKEATVPAFLKQLTEMHQNADGEALNVLFLGKAMDPLVIAYNGSNNKEIQSGLDRLVNGDKILIEAKNKSATIHAQSFLIKK